MPVARMPPIKDKKGSTSSRSGKPRPTPKAKAKSAGYGKKPANGKSKQKKKTKKNMKTSVRVAKTAAMRRSFRNNVAKKIAKQMLRDQKMRCIDPTSVTIDGNADGVYGRVFQIIDEFIFRAMIDQPQLFITKQTAGDPRIGFAILRGVWITCFQYYMFRLGCTNSDYVGPSSVAGVKLPLGLAKVFQQFAPYVDPNTGSSFRYTIPLSNPFINNVYWHIDGAVTAGQPGTNLGSVMRRTLLHASSVTSAGTQLQEYATMGSAPLQAFAAATTPWYTFFQTLDAATFSAINTIGPGHISLDDLIKNAPFAPDASAYSFIVNASVVSHCPLFPPDMALVVGRGFTNGLRDYVNNVPYDAPLPVCRVPLNGAGEAAPNTAAYNQTLTQTYAYLTARSTKWVNGPADGLLRSTKCFTDVRDFSYRGVSINPAKFARKIVNVIKSTPWDDVSISDQEKYNMLFALTAMAWTALLSRIMSSASVVCTGLNTTNMTFWVDSSTTTTLRLPSVLTKIISGVGPVKVGGRVVFPMYAGGYPIMDTVNAGGWTSALTAAGVWNVSNNEYGLGTSASATSPINITQPNSILPFVRTDPGGVVYSYIAARPLSAYVNNYQNKFPTSFISDSWTTVNDNPCGVPYAMLCPSYAVQTPTANSVFTVGTLNVSGAESISSVQSALCVNARQTRYAAAYSVIANPALDTSDYRALRQYSDGICVDISTNLQASQNASENSQFQQNVKAKSREDTAREIKTREKKGIVDTFWDAAYASDSKLLGKIEDETLDDVFPDGSGERSLLKGMLGTIGSSIRQTASRELLKIFDMSVSGQNMDGSTLFFNKALPYYGYENSSTDGGSVQLAHAEDDFGLGGLFGQ